MTFLDRPRSVFLRRALFQVHLWAGVLVALYVIVVSVTGAALVFRINLQRAVHPELLTPSAGGPLVEMATVLEQVRDAYPGGRLSGVDAPTIARPTHLAYVTRADRLHTVHSAVGVCTVVLTAMRAATGVYFAFPNEFRAAVNWASPLTDSRPPTSMPNAAGAAARSRPTWRALIELARDVEPDAFVARVVVPATDASAFQVLFTDEQPTPIGAKGLRTVYLDQFTGERLADTPRAAATLGDTIMA